MTPSSFASSHACSAVTRAPRSSGPSSEMPSILQVAKLCPRKRRVQKLRACKAALFECERGAPPQANVAKGGAGKVCLLEQHGLHAAFGKNSALRHTAKKTHVRQGPGAEIRSRKAAPLKRAPVQRGAYQGRAGKIAVQKRNIAEIRAAQVRPTQAYALQRTAAPFAFGKLCARRAAAR